MATQLLDDLVAAKAFIDTPDKWIRGKAEKIAHRPVMRRLSLASFDSNEPIAPFEYQVETVRQSCATNAVERVPAVGKDAGDRIGAMIEALYAMLPSGWKMPDAICFVIKRRIIRQFNDGNIYGHDGVMLLFDHAIAAARESARAELAAAEEATFTIDMDPTPPDIGMLRALLVGDPIKQEKADADLVDG